jgi:hypothetical protein
MMKIFVIRTRRPFSRVQRPLRQLLPLAPPFVRDYVDKNRLFPRTGTLLTSRNRRSRLDRVLILMRVTPKILN